MKNLLIFLFLVGFITSCKESVTTPDPGQLDKLLEVEIANGDLIYVSPVVNNAGVNWGPNIDITALPNFDGTIDKLTDFNGEANTNAIVAQLGENGGKAYAAKVCSELVAYGFDDWYLPAAGELEGVYQALGEYGSKEITTGAYWSSTESTGESAYAQFFSAGFDGSISTNTKDLGLFQCRCVRR